MNAAINYEWYVVNKLSEIHTVKRAPFSKMLTVIKMELLNLDNQEIRIPRKDDWNTKEFKNLFSNWDNFDYDRLNNWLEEHSKYRGVTIGVIGISGRCTPIALVKINGEYHRVHIEDVICEHCGLRNGVSGTPGVFDLYLGCPNPQEAMSISMTLPVKKCVHCGGNLQRRHTIWFEHESNN